MVAYVKCIATRCGSCLCTLSASNTSIPCMWTLLASRFLPHPYIFLIPARNLSCNWGEPERAPHWLSQAWVSPTLIMTTAPTCGIMVCQYVCISYPAFVAPWFPRSVYALKYSMYSGVCAHVHDLQLHLQLSILAQLRVQLLDWIYSCLPWRLLTKTGSWMHRYMV